PARRGRSWLAFARGRETRFRDRSLSSSPVARSLVEGRNHLGTCRRDRRSLPKLGQDVASFSATGPFSLRRHLWLDQRSAGVGRSLAVARTRQQKVSACFFPERQSSRIPGVTGSPACGRSRIKGVRSSREADI